MKRVLKLFICSLLFMQLVILTGCRAKHTIQFIVDNEAYYTIKTKGKEEIAMPKDPTKNGYIFDGWYFDEGVWNEPLTKNNFLSQKLKQDTKVYAKFFQEDITKKEYTITFNSMGGSNVNETKVLYGELATEPTTPTKKGYIFNGWYKTTDYQEKWNFTSDVVTTDVTLYAKWEEAVEYTITYVTNGGVHTNQTKYTIEDSFSLTNATKEGYTFVGWFKDQECVTEVIDKIEKGTTGNITLYASYRVNQYTISFNSMGGTNVNDITQNYDSLVKEPIAPSRSDCQFLGWYQESTLKNKYTFGTMPAKNITLYAKWKPLKLDEIIYNTDKKEVSSHDEITPQLFNAIYFDSNGEEVELSVIVNGNQIPGNTIQVRIIAKSGSSQKQVTLTDIRVYDMPELNIGKENKNSINMTDTVDKDLFQVTATDTFGNTPEIKVFVENSYQAGDCVTIVFQAIDKAGNITEKRLENIKVYGEPIITIENDKLRYDQGITINSLGAKSVDSFGVLQTISISKIIGKSSDGKYVGEIQVELTSTDTHQNTATVVKNIKIYDIPMVNLVDEEKGYAITTDTNIDFLFLIKDSFGQELSATITADKELKVGTVVNITVKAVDIAGNIFEKTYSFGVIDETKAYVELYMDHVLYKQLVVDKENYTLPITDNNGNDDLLWLSASNKFYTNSSGKGIEVLQPSNKLHGIPFKTVIKEIDEINDLNSIRSDPTSVYVLTTDIDLGGIEWTPIDFSGVFYGNNHIIKNFKITNTNSSDYYGLFGKNNGVVYNLGVEGFEISVESSKNVYVGGLAGGNFGTISNSYATGNVTATSISTSSHNYVVCAGGLVGHNSGTISNSYATGNATATAASSYIDAYAGGLVGHNSGTISNSYATGNATATSYKYAYAGGLVGDNNRFVTIKNSYATGNVTATSTSSTDSAYAGGLVGDKSVSGTISNSYCYSEQIVKSSTDNINNEGVAKSMEELTSVSFYTNTLCWDDDIWKFIEKNLPELKKTGDSNQIIFIKTIDDLETIRKYPSLTCILTTDIDLGGIEWNPIDFSGVLFGKNHIISNFKITKTNSSDNYGLFGKNTGIIRDLGVEDFEISVKSINDVSDYAGGLVGYNYGTIGNSYATGNVTVTGDYTNVCVGGLVGYNNGGNISNSYATGNVTATSLASFGCALVGGLVGENFSGTINNSYATGNVTATSYSDALVGGLVGENFSGTINNSYATGNVTATAIDNCYAGGLVGDNWDGTISNSYRYSGQIIESSTNDMNTEGIAKSMKELTSVSFYINTLGWDENIWVFTEGSLPKLKKTK